MLLIERHVSAYSEAIIRFNSRLRHMKVVRLSALCTCRLYHQDLFLVLISV